MTRLSHSNIKWTGFDFKRYSILAMFVLLLCGQRPARVALQVERQIRERKTEDQSWGGSHAPETLTERVVSFSLGVRRWVEVHGLFGAYQYNGSVVTHLLSVSRFLLSLMTRKNAKYDVNPQALSLMPVKVNLFQPPM